ncbi:MAG: cadherin-like beta sandwich domain-containing protein [Candidatus Aphodocola sp.]
MKKKLILLFILMAVIFIPVSIKAENKIYFETDEVNIELNSTKKINILVDSDEDFTKVNFNLITTSYNVGFYSVEFNEAFVRNASSAAGSNYELESKTPQKSGTIIGSVTLIAKDSAYLNEQGYIRLTKASITTNGLIDLPSTQLKFMVSNKKSSNNYLSSLSSDIVNIDFDKEVLDYSVVVKSNVNKLDLVGVPEDSKATVTILDQSLKSNKTKIKVMVKAEDGNERIYTVTVNKKNEKKVTATTTKKSMDSFEKSSKLKWGIIFFALIIIVIIDVLYIKKKR